MLIRADSIGNVFEDAWENVKVIYADINDFRKEMENAMTEYITSLKYKTYITIHEPKHHIVAQTSPYAEDGRLVLYEVGIAINDEENVVKVNQGIHYVMHRKVYYNMVNNSVKLGKLVAGHEGVIAVLRIYKKVLGGAKK